jgi:putative peptide zinc metalloprotease protein
LIDPEVRRQLLGGLRLDVVDGEESYVLVGPHGVPMRLSRQAHLILSGVAEGRTSEEIAQTLSAAGGPTTPTAIERRTSELLTRIAHIEAHPRRQVGFWMKRQIIGPAVVDRIARATKWCFDPRVAGAGLVLATVCGSIALIRASTPTSAAAPLLGYAIFLLSLVAHEFGHAAASARFGVAPSGIGIVMYLIYPAFFSDVTQTWRLPRRQRVLVDLGGLYFQSLFAAALCLAAALWPAPAIGFGLALIGLSLLSSLNPFLRFDGYWIFIDTLGLSSTSSARGSVLRALTARIRGRTADARWPLSTVVAFAVYLALLPFAWAYLIAAIGPVLVAQLLGYPAALGALSTALLEGRVQPGQVEQFLVATFVALGALILGYRLVLACAAGLQRLFRLRVKRPLVVA